MCSHPDKLPESYSRYLVNGYREDFDMPGPPVRLTMRGQGDKNPYKGRRKKKPGALGKHIGKLQSKQHGER
jgi:GTP-binding protein